MHCTNGSLGATLLLLVTAPVAQAAQVTLRYWSFLDPKDPNPRSVAQTKIIEDFMAKNPDIAVKVEVVHWSKIVPMLITAAGAGQAPDVALIHSSRMPMAIEAGAVIPLDPYVAAWTEKEKTDFLLPFEANAVQEAPLLAPLGAPRGEHPDVPARPL